MPHHPPLVLPPSRKLLRKPDPRLVGEAAHTHDRPVSVKTHPAFEHGCSPSIRIAEVAQGSSASELGAGYVVWHRCSMSALICHFPTVRSTQAPKRGQERSWSCQQSTGDGSGRERRGISSQLSAVRIGETIEQNMRNRHKEVRRGKFGYQTSIFSDPSAFPSSHFIPPNEGALDSFPSGHAAVSALALDEAPDQFALRMHLKTGI